MKSKILLSTLIYSLIGAILLFQTNIIFALASDLDSPITSPITSPIDNVENPIPAQTPQPTLTPSPTPTPYPTPTATSSATPTPQPINNNTSYNLGVLVLKYFPLTSNGQNIDGNITGDVADSYSFIRQRTIDVTNNLLSVIPKATSYLGYKDGNSQPALNYHVVDTKEFTTAVPIKPRSNSPRYPDYNGIMNAQNICDYVDNKGVSEVWLWAYQGPNKSDGQPYLGISESKMSGPSGDISNSYRYNDMPVCQHTYRVLTFNYQRGTAEAFHSWGHQMESELDAVDYTLFRNNFQRRCGSVHNPPNARHEYDYANPTPQNSDCLDWNGDNIATSSAISCENWGCEEVSDTNIPGLNYLIWMWQNLPGRNNTKTYQGKVLRNLWDVHGDFDNVMGNKRVVRPTPTPVPTATSSATPTATSSATPTPTASSSATPVLSIPISIPILSDINPSIAAFGDTINIRSLWKNLTDSLIYVGNALMPQSSYQYSNSQTAVSFTLAVNSALQEGRYYLVYLIDALGGRSNSLDLAISAPVVNPITNPSPAPTTTPAPSPAPTSTPSPVLAPVITTISPNPATQGAIVTITGSNFTNSSKVYVGGSLMPSQFNTVSEDGRALTFLINTETNFTANQTYPVYVANDNVNSNQISLTIAPSFLTTIPNINSNQYLIAPAVTLDPAHPEVVFANSNFNTFITIPKTVANPILSFTNLLNTSANAANAVVDQQITINSDTSQGNIGVQIPAWTTISGPANWNGKINAPQVLSNASVTPTADARTTITTQSVIEIGLGDTPLSFNKAVRILMKGQAGKLTGFQRGTTFTKITQSCNADTQVFADALAENGDCYISLGNDLVIWTKHFTKFVTYIQTPVPQSSSSSNTSSSGSGGSSGSSSSQCVDAKPQSAPKLLSAAVSGRNQVTLTWSKALDPVTYYLVTYGTKPGQPEYGNPNIGGKDTTSYIVKGLENGRDYYFKVRAGNHCMSGEFSNELAVKASGDKRTGPATGFKQGVLSAQNQTASIEAELKFKPITEAKPQRVIFEGAKILSLIVNFLSNLFARS